MKTPLTLQRLFLGLNGMAIEGQELNIVVRPEIDSSTGEVVGTKWNLNIENRIDENGDSLVIKDYLAGYKIDDENFNVQMKFYDATGKFPRLIADRISSVQKNTSKRKRKKGNSNSAFNQLLMIIKNYYEYIDDDVISILQNMKIMKAKCNIIYPLLIEIPDTIQTNNDLLKHFYSLGLMQLKNADINLINEQFKKYMDSIDDEIINTIRKNYLSRNKIRYWKKVLVLKNGKRYWLSNHIFINSIKPFKELMIDLTGVAIRTINPNNNNLSQNASFENTSFENNFSKNDFSNNNFNNSNNTNSGNNNLLDNLINTNFGFGIRPSI